MNKHIYKFFFWLLCMGWVAVACNDDDDNGLSYEYVTEEGSSNFVLKGYGHESFAYGDNVLKPLDLASPIYIENTNLSGRAYAYALVQAARLDEVKEVPASGYEPLAPIEENRVYVARYSDLYKEVYIKLRIVQVAGSEVTLEYAQLKEEIYPNGNANLAEGEDMSVTRIEMPRRNKANAYAPHYVTVDGEEVLNVAIEWNDPMKHAQWVAFTFDNVTGWDKGVGRADKVIPNFVWPEDELLPEAMRVGESSHKNDGFDKGHLCASEDRQYLQEANVQTFYYSNMSPQLNSFNGGIWAKLEKLVQTWGYSVSKGDSFDKVYVTKGGTLNKLLKNFTGAKNGGDGKKPTTNAEGKTVHGLACPAYYFMAILAQKGNTYQAIAFLLPHDENLKSSDDLKQFVLSVDELEEQTSNDFFCNLPDTLENAVESSMDINLWSWE